MHSITSCNNKSVVQSVYTYLYNVLCVLCGVLENGATVLQVCFIKAECLGINLLERRVAELRFLQVDQEVSVDWTTLNKTHSVGGRVVSLIIFTD